MNLIEFFRCSFTPTGLTSSLTLILAELYLVIRFFFLRLLEGPPLVQLAGPVG